MVLMLEWAPCGLRHGPSHVLAWRRVCYEILGLRVECVAEEEEGGLVAKRFRFRNDLLVTVRELPPTADNTTGLGVWDASIALAAIAAACENVPTSVLELGCGVALPSATLAQRGATVLATDASDDLVDHARRTLGIKAQVLHWQRPALEKTDFDLVIGAEVLYAASAVFPVASVLRTYARDRVWIVGLARRRPLLDKLIDALKDDFSFLSKPITISASSPDFNESSPSPQRLTVDDQDRVQLLFLEGRRLTS